VNLPSGTGILIVVAGVPIASWLILRRTGAVSRRVWFASTVAATILGLEFVAPGTVRTAITQLTSEQVVPPLLLLIGGVLFLYFRLRRADESTPEEVTNVSLGITASDEEDGDCITTSLISSFSADRRRYRRPDCLVVYLFQ
jgi:hypothetical protein